MNPLFDPKNSESKTPFPSPLPSPYDTTACLNILRKAIANEQRHRQTHLVTPTACDWWISDQPTPSSHGHSSPSPCSTSSTLPTSSSGTTPASASLPPLPPWALPRTFRWKRSSGQQRSPATYPLWWRSSGMSRRWRQMRTSGVPVVPSPVIGPTTMRRISSTSSSGSQRRRICGRRGRST